jgi:hypothetical protein
MQNGFAVADGADTVGTYAERDEMVFDGCGAAIAQSEVVPVEPRSSRPSTTT